jgi:hypothetical protein
LDELGVLRGWVQNDRDERVDRRLLGDQMERPSLGLSVLSQ